MASPHRIAHPTDPVPLIAHDGLALSPGDFGADPALRGLRLPTKLERVARALGASHTHNFLSLLSERPEALAAALGWGLPDVERARAAFFERMRGKAPEALLGQSGPSAQASEAAARAPGALRAPKKKKALPAAEAPAPAT